MYVSPECTSQGVFMASRKIQESGGFHGRVKRGGMVSCLQPGVVGSIEGFK